MKKAIEAALTKFPGQMLADAASQLFEVLGYSSNKRLKLTPNNLDNFLATFAEGKSLNDRYALTGEWKSIDFLFQLSDDEIRAAGNRQFLFESNGLYNGAVINSYLFFALELKRSQYTRTALAGITRELNKLFAMPALVLFRHGETMTLAVIPRRLSKKDAGKDVLEKVTLIKDVQCRDTHRAHIEILVDLSLDALHDKYGFTNFVQLQNAWQKTLDSSELNKRFYQEIANWYFWACGETTFPKDAGKDKQTRNAVSLIRLITRLIFVWFVKEKGLIPDDLFDQRKVAGMLKNFGGKESAYYKAILQNLFFATLNTEMSTPQNSDNRRFRANRARGRDQHYMIHNLYRYRDLLKEPDQLLQQLSTVPFLNGGLFECLDKFDEKNASKVIRIDGFSDRPDNEVEVPDHLFFSDEKAVDLNEIYGTKNKRYKVRGLIDIFNHYKFTITENTPIEEEIALDPELLGRVFENLLASYNPETETTARKQTGSFYTPREIVNYMVDESLIIYLENKLSAIGKDNINERLRQLLAYNDQPHPFSPTEIDALISAIDTVKILDPACGSGAFPMGILHKLVFILAKLDPRNEKWKQRQIARVKVAIKAAEQIEDANFRERSIEELEQQISDINEAFERNELDYGRKLFLIENCIYGVDIQPIACQIAKLRFFISLVVDQRLDNHRLNRGIRPLPNLETKFVAANTLLSVQKPAQLVLRNEDIDKKEKELAEVRRNYLTARSPRTKAKYRERDKELRAVIAALLQKDGFPRETTEKLARWDPYDQNGWADFFDPEWMFGITAESKTQPSMSTLRGSLSIINQAGGQGELTPVEEINDGFDVIIGNPPYVRQEEIKEFKPAFKELYECFTGVADLYVYFYERSIKLLRTGGVLTFISSNKFFRSGYGEKLRAFLSQKTSLQQVIDFHDAPVFTAISYPCIVILTRQPPNGNQSRVMTWQPGPAIEDFASVFEANGFSMSQKELNSDGWRLESPAVLRLLDKLRATGKPLREFVGSRVYRGITTGFNEGFVVDNTTRDRLIREHKSSNEILKPYLRGRDVNRWCAESQKQWIIFTRRGIEIKKYPAIERHLQQFKKELTPGKPGGRKPGSYEWYEIQDNIAYWRDFETAKIVSTKISIRPTFALDEDKSYLGNTSYFVSAANNGRYLLGLLNSSMFFTYAKKVFVEKQGGWFEVQPDGLESFPVPATSPEQQKAVERLVDRILVAKQRDAEADVSALEREIDELVYALYGLTSEEIAIIEESRQEKTGSAAGADDEALEQER